MRGPLAASVILHVVMGLAMVWADRVETPKLRPLPEATVVKLVRPRSIPAAPPPAVVEKEFKQPETKPALEIPKPQRTESKKPAPEIKEPPKLRSTKAPAGELKGEAGTLRLQQPGFEYDFYLAVVQSKIERNFRPPPGIRGQAMATVSFQIEKNGTIAGIGLLKSSGNLLIDQAAERAVRAAGRFPPLPAQYDKGELGIYFEFVVNPTTGG